jgi:hypothetical protein
MNCVIGCIRPLPAGRGRHPISIAEASSDPVQCPVFGEQIDIYTASTRPEPVLMSQSPKQPGTAALSFNHAKPLHMIEGFHRGKPFSIALLRAVREECAKTISDL